MIGIQDGQFFAGFGVERMLLQMLYVFGGLKGGIGLRGFEVVLFGGEPEVADAFFDDEFFAVFG